MMPSRLSVRARLALWHASVLALIVLATSGGLYLLIEWRLYHLLDAQVARDLAAIERVTRTEPEELDELESQIGILYYEVYGGGRLVYRSGGWTRSGLTAEAVEGTSKPHSWTAPGGGALRVGAIHRPDLRIALAIDENPVRRTLDVLAGLLWIALPCVLALGLAGGYFLAGRALASVGALAAKARQISADSLTERLPAGNPDDEFGRLAAVLNDALARVHASFEQLRRFTSDASHELRTPLTAMRSTGEVAMQRRLDADQYRDVIGSMLEEVQRLTQIVENLLTLTRAESGTQPAHREVVDLVGLAAGVAGGLRVLAEEKRQQLRIDSETASLRALCDPVALRQSLMNLVHNAIKFTPADGHIGVTVRRLSDTEAAIETRDDGPGIPSEHRGRIFDRFYRVDAGRSREAGGVGLGLAIAKWAAEASEGRIELESEEGRGSLFRIVLPLAA
jgi:signal transduction histidine kinase